MKKIFLFLPLLLFGIQVFAATVTESFDSWSDAGYAGSSSYNGWVSDNALAGTPARTGAKCVRLNDDSGAGEYLMYEGSDGNGKDGGVGTITFWYRHWDGNVPSEQIQFELQYSQNGGAWTTIGSAVSVTSTTYSQHTASANLTGDNIRIRVITIVDQERLCLDDFTITDYASCSDPAPSDQDSEILFETRGFSYFDISWTEASDGQSSLVMINTMNSFTAPSDGDNPSASATYGGSGQQVVYNGTGNTATITGLDSGIVYYVRVYAYNCTGGNTKFNTSTNTGNPASEETLVCPCVPGTFVLDPNSDGGFESGNNFPSNGWNVNNDGTNNDWVVGNSATGLTGANCAFVSEDGGISHTYDNTAGSDISFQTTVDLSGFEAGSIIKFDFDWKGWCDDGSFDAMEVSVNGSTVLTDLHNQNSWKTESIDISQYVGNGSLNLEFRWYIGTFTGDNFPHAVDNVAVYNVVASNAVLPLNQFEVSGHGVDRANIIEWTYDRYEEVDYFVVEKSRDGKLFNVIGEVEVDKINNYTFKDYQTDLLSYYRIGAVQKERKTIYSNIVRVSRKAQQEVNIYPNPTRGIVNVEIEHEDQERYGKLSLYDIVGNKLSSREIYLYRGLNTYSINLVQLAAGMYVITVPGYTPSKVRVY